jgi:hypothetical protein
MGAGSTRRRFGRGFLAGHSQKAAIMLRIIPLVVAIVAALASAAPAQNPPAKVRRPSYRVIDGGVLLKI